MFLKNMIGAVIATIIIGIGGALTVPTTADAQAGRLVITESAIKTNSVIMQARRMVKNFYLSHSAVTPNGGVVLVRVCVADSGSVGKMVVVKDTVQSEVLTVYVKRVVSKLKFRHLPKGKEENVTFTFERK